MTTALLEPVAATCMALRRPRFRGLAPAEVLTIMVNGVVNESAGGGTRWPSRSRHATSAAASISTISSSADLFEHPLTRTVTQMDNMLFSNMTLNPQPLHIDRHFCEQETEWGQPLMNSLFTLGLMIGIRSPTLTVGTTIANLGMTEVKFPAPAVRGRHRALHHRGDRQARSRNRARAPASSNSTTAPTIRTTSWWPSAAGRSSSRMRPR